MELWLLEGRDRLRQCPNGDLITTCRQANIQTVISPCIGQRSAATFSRGLAHRAWNMLPTLVKSEKNKKNEQRQCSAACRGV